MNARKPVEFAEIPPSVGVSSEDEIVEDRKYAFTDDSGTEGITGPRRGRVSPACVTTDNDR